MKMMVAVALIASSAITVQAQGLVGAKMTDNWSIGVNGGVVTPLSNNPFWKSMRANMGLEVAKQLTPIVGVGVEGMWGVNTSDSKTIFDHSNVSVIGKVNLMNLFGGYKGTPRLFEIETVTGAGWLHGYGAGNVFNSLSTKAGLNFNFNLGEAKAWTIAFKPAVVWDMNGNPSRTQFNVNNAVLQLNAGVVYHFKGSNNKHHFSYAKLYNQNEIDNLNSDINNLRTQLTNCNEVVAVAENTIDDLNGQIAKLQSELDECLNRAPIVETVSTKTMESVVTFNQGQTSVSSSQIPNVERIATYLKNNKGSKVVIKGYASPEGSAEVNARVAKARAEAVKNMLVQKYKISASRISAEGQGVGNMFSEPDWNRVSICTLVAE